MQYVYHLQLVVTYNLSFANVWNLVANVVCISKLIVKLIVDPWFSSSDYI
jgi:hypothetical protein